MSTKRPSIGPALALAAGAVLAAATSSAAARTSTAPAVALDRISPGAADVIEATSLGHWPQIAIDDVKAMTAAGHARFLTGGGDHSVGVALNDGAPMGLLVLGLVLLCRRWLFSRRLATRKSRSGTIQNETALSESERALLEIAATPRQASPRTPALVQRAPAAPESSLHDSVTAPLAIANEVHSVAAGANDVTVIDSYAAVRAMMEGAVSETRRP